MTSHLLTPADTAPPTGAAATAPEAPEGISPAQAADLRALLAIRENAAEKPAAAAAQSYEAAAWRHLKDDTGPQAQEAAQLLAVALRGVQRRSAGISAEAVLAVLFSQVLLGPRISFEEVAMRAQMLSELDVADVLERAESTARRAGLLARRCFERQRFPSEHLRRAVKLACGVKLSEKTADALKLPAPLPWDSFHDGHLASRRAAWALGIVRWSRSADQKALMRLTAAAAALAERMDLEGAALERAAALFTARRPVVLLGQINLYTVKLVHDLWLADPSVAVVSLRPMPQKREKRDPCDPPRQRNPFHVFAIPFLEDPEGRIADLLGVDHFPSLIEPRLGGFTVTAATGLASLVTLPRRDRRARGFAVPAWMRTLAEIGLLARWEDGGIGQTTEMHSAAVRLKFLSLYEELIRTPLLDERRVFGPEGEAVNHVRKHLEEKRAEVIALLAEAKTEAQTEIEETKKAEARRDAEARRREAASAPVVLKRRRLVLETPGRNRAPSSAQKTVEKAVEKTVQKASPQSAAASRRRVLTVRCAAAPGPAVEDGQKAAPKARTTNSMKASPHPKSTTRKDAA